VTETLPWLVCEEEGRLIGYAYASQWRERSAYRHSVEATVYLHPTAVRKGKGAELFGALLSELRAREIHCVMGGVALPNPASIALLEKFGLRQVAHFKEVGHKFGQWIDVGYWQLVF
jgi:phosphinothricin acetyltransferase